MNPKNYYHHPLVKLHPTTKILFDLSLVNKTQQYRGSQYLNLKKLHKAPEAPRNYIPGDPIRLIDWRTYARNNELIIRQKDNKTNLRIAIICDYNKTMHWPDLDFQKSLNLGICSKLYYALLVSLHLAYQHKTRDDYVTLYLTKENEIYSCNITKPHQTILMYQSIQKNYLKKDQSFVYFKKSTSHDRLYDKAYFLSDALADLEFEKHFITKETYFIHTLSSLETDTQWIKKDDSYHDRNPTGINLIGKQIQDKNYYQKALSHWIQLKQKKILHEQKNYLLLNEKTKIKDYLKKILL